MDEVTAVKSNRGIKWEWVKISEKNGCETYVLRPVQAGFEWEKGYH